MLPPPLYAMPKAMNCETGLKMRERKGILLLIIKNPSIPVKPIRRNAEDILAVHGHDYAFHLLLHTVRSIVCADRFLPGIF